MEANDDYQQKRASGRFELERRTFYRELLDWSGERATEIFYVFEALAFRYFQDRRDAQDAEVLEGIQSLRRSYSLIEIPETGIPAFGEELRKEFKVFGERQALEPTMVTEVLDRAQTFIQKLGNYVKKAFRCGLSRPSSMMRATVPVATRIDFVDRFALLIMSQDRGAPAPIRAE